MKKPWILGLVLVAVLVGGGFYWQRNWSLTSQVARARGLVGTRSADPILNQLTERNPRNAEVQFLRARQARLFGQSLDALAALSRAAELGWPQAQVERERLLVLAQTDIAQAEAPLQALLDTQPDDEEVLQALAFGYGRAGYLTKSDALVQRVLQLDPDNGAAVCMRGAIALRREKYDRARPDLEAAFRRGPDQYYYRDARQMLARCLMLLGRFEESLELYRQCRAEDPTDVAVNFQAGQCARFLKRWDEAFDAFQTVLRQQPDHLDALLQLAYIHEERGEMKPARELLEQAEKQAPELPVIHFHLARTLRALGETGRAMVYQKRYDEGRKREEEQAAKKKDATKGQGSPETPK